MFPTSTENPFTKSKMFFFSVQTRRLQESFEGSYSSLAYSSEELSGLSQATVAASGRHMHFLILGVKWGFWVITLVLDMLEGQAKALSTREII